MAWMKIIAGVAATVVMACAAAEEATPKPKLTLSSPTVVSLCWDRCVDIAMPKQAGPASYIVEGDFVRDFPFSWVAMSEQHASVCTFVPRAPQVKCIRIKARPPQGKKMEVFGSHIGDKLIAVMRPVEASRIPSIVECDYYSDVIAGVGVCVMD